MFLSCCRRIRDDADGEDFNSARAIIGQIESVPDGERGKPRQAQLVDALGNLVESIALADLNSAFGIRFSGTSCTAPPNVRYERYVMTVQGVFQQESYLTDEIDFVP